MAQTYNLIMLSDTQNNIETLITKLLIDSRYKKAIEYGQQNYQIRQFKIDNLTPNEIFSMHYLIKTKFYYNKPEANNDSWFQNQLKLFIWLLVCYSYLQQRCISKLASQDFQFFSQIFNHKNPDIFQFQARSILKKKIKFAKWTLEQINLLDSIIKQKRKKNKWNQIAKQLFIVSSKRFFRTAKQCREHWINHLDPVPVRSQWTNEEDYELVKAVRQTGKKWSKVSKMFQGTRTEHMVKNRFNSLYHFQVKKCKHEQNKTVKEQDVILELERRLSEACIEQNAISIQNNSNDKRSGNNQNLQIEQIPMAQRCLISDQILSEIQEISNDIQEDLRSQEDLGFKLPSSKTLVQGNNYEQQYQQKNEIRSHIDQGQEYQSFFHEQFN